MLISELALVSCVALQMWQIAPLGFPTNQLFISAVAAHALKGSAFQSSVDVRPAMPCHVLIVMFQDSAMPFHTSMLGIAAAALWAVVALSYAVCVQDSATNMSGRPPRLPCTA